MKLTEAEMRMVFQIESTYQNAALNEIYMTWRYAFDTEGMTDESIANAPYRWMGYSLLVTFLTSVLGIALFRKKEIR